MLSVESYIYNNNTSYKVTSEQFTNVTKKKCKNYKQPNLKTLAFDLAQEKFINECLDICEKNNSEYKKINNIEDKIIINIQNEEFIFSRKEFFNNNYFREKLVEVYKMKNNINILFISNNNNFYLKTYY